MAVLGFEFVLKIPYFGPLFKENDYNEYRYSWLDAFVPSDSDEDQTNEFELSNQL